MSLIKSESLAKLAPALVKAQKSMGAALKDSKNPFFKSKYADLNAIIDAAIPSLNEQGIAVLQTPQLIQSFDGSKATPVIQTVLLHESGEFIAGNSEIVAAKSNDPQAAGSATTYARRYGLQAMVTLKAEDDDGEGAMGRKATPAPVKAEIGNPQLAEEAPVTASTQGSVQKKGGFLKTKKAAAQPAETNEGGDLF
jgi:hypothetical protein